MVKVKSWHTRDGIELIEFVDEEYEDYVDNDHDGQLHEDLNDLPIYPLVDEEILDYYVNEPGGTDYISILSSAITRGRMTMVMHPWIWVRLEYSILVLRQLSPSPTGVLLGYLVF